MTARSLATFACLALLATVASATLAPPTMNTTGQDLVETTEAFLKSLDESQLAKVKLDYDSDERGNWNYVPLPTRKGLTLREMSGEQRKAAAAMLRSCLSEAGFTKAEKIRQLEAILAELEKDTTGRRDPLKYYVTVYGTPGEGDWGCSYEGHHLSLNFTLKDDSVVSVTPQFFGSNPADVPSDLDFKLAGKKVLAAEDELGFRLLNSLDESQRDRAIISDTAPRDITAADQPSLPEIESAGLPIAELTDEQEDILVQLVATYLKNNRPDVVQRIRQRIQSEDISEAVFSWQGGTRPGMPHFYRIQGPSLVIEMANTQADPLGNPANHVHAVMRDPRGDFGMQ